MPDRSTEPAPERPYARLSDRIDRLEDATSHFYNVINELRRRVSTLDCLPPRQHGRNQKNPGNRGKENGVNVSNGSTKSARKNTASVSAEPTTDSTIKSLSCARLMTCNTKRNGEKFHGGASHTAPNPAPQKGVTSIMLRIRLRRYRDALGKNNSAIAANPLLPLASPLVPLDSCS